MSETKRVAEEKISADSGQRGLLVQDFESAFDIFVGDLFNESGDVDANGASANAALATDAFLFVNFSSHFFLLVNG